MKIPLILGPTCSWKSAVAARLANKAGGEVVSLDSMQIYKGLPIGTAQPGEEELALARHHLVACLELDEVWNVSRFIEVVKPLLKSIAGSGKLPVLAGGSGLYARALVYGFSLMPSDAALAEELRLDSSTEEGCDRLRAELAASWKIPEDVARNPRHLARAVEVTRLTGRPPWEHRRDTATPDPAYAQFCIMPDFQKLKERIRARTAAMLERGWVDECARALENGLATAPTAWQALGYRDIAAFLEGRLPHGIGELQEILANRTIQYARRQITWFKHQHPDAHQIRVDDFEGDVPARIIDEIEGRWTPEQ